MSDLQILGVDPTLPHNEPTNEDSAPSKDIDKGEGHNISSTNRDDQFTAGHETPEIATNDGSVIETLDTALHGTPGWSEGENLSGSNRADYYEARSYGKTDVEEELEDLRQRNKEEGNK